MDAVSGLFLNALGTDMVTMEEYFPFITKAFDVMQYTAWAVLFLIVVWQLFRAFGGPITEAENPWQLDIPFDRLQQQLEVVPSERDQQDQNQYGPDNRHS